MIVADSSSSDEELYDDNVCPLTDVLSPAGTAIDEAGMEASLRAHGSFNEEKIDECNTSLSNSDSNPLQAISVDNVATGTGSSEETINLESCQLISEATKEAPAKASGASRGIKESTYCFCGETHVGN